MGGWVPSGVSACFSVAFAVFGCEVVVVAGVSGFPWVAGLGWLSAAPAEGVGVAVGLVSDGLCVSDVGGVAVFGVGHQGLGRGLDPVVRTVSGCGVVCVCWLCLVGFGVVCWGRGCQRG